MRKRRVSGSYSLLLRIVDHGTMTNEWCRVVFWRYGNPLKESGGLGRGELVSKIWANRGQGLMERAGGGGMVLVVLMVVEVGWRGERGEGWNGDGDGRRLGWVEVGGLGRSREEMWFRR